MRGLEGDGVEDADHAVVGVHLLASDVESTVRLCRDRVG
jgi:hypothetical protein